jgi:predicted dithiol-disulfide oxidoreductase (DUF899 family)
MACCAKELLAKEKELTRHRDALNAERRRLPMVEIDKDYVFEGLNGQASLFDLFDGRRQLIVYHFMFEPGAHLPASPGSPTTRAARAARSCSTTSATSRACTRATRPRKS